MTDWVSLLKKLPQNKEGLMPYLKEQREFYSFMYTEYPNLPECTRREVERNLATRKGARFLDLLQLQKQAAVRGWATIIAGFLPAELRIPLLFNALGDRDEEVKLLATERLADLKSVEVARELVNGLESGKWLPARIAEVLSNLGDLSLPFVSRLIDSPSDQLRLNCVEILEQINTSAAGRLIIRLLDDPSDSVRKRAASALAALLGAAAGAELFAALQKEQNSACKIQLIRLLGRLKYIPARDYIEAYLQSEDPKLINASATALDLLNASRGAD